MKYVETRSKEKVAFFDPLTQKPRQPAEGSFSPHFRGAQLQDRPVHHVFAPIKKTDTERD